MEDNQQDFEIGLFGDNLVVNSLMKSEINFISFSYIQKLNAIKKHLKTLISKDDDCINFDKVTNENVIFENFKLILFNMEETSFVKCENCDLILKFNANNFESFKKHVSDCKVLNNEIDEKLIINKSHKHDLADECAYYSAVSCRPFRTFETKSFHRLAQQLVNLGSTYGSFDVSKVLPVGTTVSSHIPSVAKKVKDALRKIIDELENYVLIFDHWSPKYVKTKYLGIKLYFYDPEIGKFKSRLLVNKAVVDGCSDTTLKYYDEVFKEYNINELKVVAVVTGMLFHNNYYAL